MRKVYTKGIDLANKHLMMAAMAYNLKKLIQLNAIKSTAKSIRNNVSNLKAVIFSEIMLFYNQFVLFLIEKKPLVCNG
jgi:hypothetical protein